MRIRFGAVLIAVFALLLVVACGGGDKKAASTTTGGTTPAGADYVPSAATGFVSIVTDRDSEQWNAGRDLLNKFPGKDQIIAQFEQALAQQQLDFERDIDPALGAEVALGILGLEGGNGQFVGLTQPDDAGALQTLMGKLAQSGGDQPVLKRIGDWTAVSDAQSAVDAAASAKAGTSLFDNTGFDEAMKALPSDAIARLWFDGAAITRAAQGRTGGTGSIPGYGQLVSLAAALRVQSNGTSVTGVVETDRDVASRAYASKLVSQVPAGVLAYLSFAGFDEAIKAIGDVPAVKQQLGQIETQLGVTLAELAPLFAGEGAIYVRQGVPIPEVTIALEQSDEAAAKATADKLFVRVAPALQGQSTTTTISGVTVNQIKSQNFSLFYGVFDGKLVITSATTGISGLKSGDQKLADDALFNDAKDAAGMPDETAGFFYVNLKDAIPLIENAVTSFGGGTIDPTVQQNLEPLKSLLLFASVDGRKATFSGFLGVE